MNKFKSLTGLLAPSLLLAMASPALAQEAPQASQQASEGGLEEIIVTAQKRSENIQDVPIVVNAVDGDTLTSSGVSGLEGLQQVSPSFNFRSSIAGNLASIRGVSGDFSGPSGESPIAVNFDGVYIGTDSGYFYPFFSVARVDVLSGPQGTLFGRNATGGVVNIVTREPSHEFSGQASLGYANYDTSTAELYLTGGLSNALAGDIAVSIRRQGEGFGTNLFNGQDVGAYDSDAVRGSLLWDVSESTTVRLSGDYHRYDGSTYGSHALFGSANNTTIDSGGTQDMNLNVQPVSKIEGHGLTLHVNHDLVFADLVSISAYRSLRKVSDTDIDGGPNQDFSIYNDERNRQYSQELRLDGDDAGPLTWLVGLYYFDYEGGYEPTILGTPSLTLSNVNNSLTTKAYAVFAQGTYEILPATNLTLGARYSWEDRTADGTGSGLIDLPVFPHQTLHEESPTWRVSLDHHFTDDIMAYISYNTGFKSGGFNAISLASGGFDSETIDAVEAGVKTEFFDRRLRFNASAYSYDYANLQVTDVSTGFPVVVNAASAEIRGAEAQLSVLLAEGLTVDAGIAYNDAQYVDYPGASCVTYDPSAPPATTPTSVVCNAGGRSLLRSPEWTFTIAPHYTFSVGEYTIDTTVSYYHASEQDFLFTDSPSLMPPARDNVNASIEIALPGDRASVTLWANNLMDEEQISFISAVPVTPFSGHGLSSFYLPPRTYGARLNLNF